MQPDDERSSLVEWLEDLVSRFEKTGARFAERTRAGDVSSPLVQGVRGAEQGGGRPGHKSDNFESRNGRIEDRVLDRRCADDRK